LLFILLTPAFSQNQTTNEFWPEAQLFYELQPGLRLVISAKRERDIDFKNTETGAELEYSFHRRRPIIDSPWVDLDATRRALVSIRIGYKYKLAFDEPRPVHENRPHAEFTTRKVFIGNILVSNRALWEFRLISGSPYSWRYRNRLQVEKDLRLNRYSFTCYLAGEPFYNSGKSSWNQFRFSTGVVLPVGRRLAVEPYYLRQIINDSEPRYTNALGLVGKVYWGK